MSLRGYDNVCIAKLNNNRIQFCDREVYQTKYAFSHHLPQSRGMADLAVPSTRFHAIYHNREVWQSSQCQVRVFTPYTTIARYDRARSAKYAFSRHFSILPWGFLPMKQHCLSAGDHPPCLKWVCRDNYPWIEAASQRETGCFV